MTYTTIRCTTCTSTVPWGPHCPDCGAYLEFAGDPPWRPAPEMTPSSPDAVAAVDHVDHEDASVDPVDGGVVTVDTEAELDITRTHTSATAVPGEAEDRPRLSYEGTAGVLVAGALVSPLIWWTVGPVLGAATAVVFVVWAFVLWPQRVEVPSVEAESDLSVETVETIEVAAVEMTTVEVQAPPEIQARPPQSLARRTVEATRPIATDQVEGDVPCGACARLNPASRSYCVWCGRPMIDASLAPDTIPVIESEVPDEVRRNQRRQGRRGPSRSWYAPIIVITLVGVLVTSIIFTVFGPGAFRVRFGMTTVYQLINQFIDPYAGRSAVIDTVTASSSLRGTRPEDVVGGDATTFWASQPSPQQGAGNDLVFTFTGESTINRLVIFPGVQNRIFDTRAVATPHDITLTFDDGTTVTDELDPLDSESDLQQLVRFPKVTTRTVRLTIDSVYPPRATSADIPTEVAISGILFLMPPEPPAFMNLPTDVQPRTSLPGMVS